MFNVILHPAWVKMYFFKIWLSCCCLLILLFASLFTTNALGGQTSWEKAIANVSELSKKLYKRAERFNASTHLGTMYNEYMAEEHRCSILGRMLGKKQLIHHLEKDINEKSTNGHELTLQAWSLEIWVRIAKRLVKMDRGGRIALWNLNCAGHLGIPGSAFIKAPKRKEEYFDLVGLERRTVRVIADIETGFADRLANFLKENDNIDTVSLGSHGGSVKDAIKAGMMIRERGISTSLWNNCYSACALVFIGGKDREITLAIDLGFHQVSRDGKAIEYSDPTYKVIHNYGEKMGVNSEKLLNFMLKAGPDSMYIPKYQELCDARIATWIPRIC